MTPIAFIRHGPTEWNETHRLQGLADNPLSEAGLAKVGNWRLPDEFRGWDWVASPLVRAQQTARMLGIEFRVEPQVREMDWGGWEGRTRDELIAAYGQEFHDRAAKGLDLRPDGGETPREVRTRVAAWIDEVARRGRPAGAVAHQGIIRAALSLATGWEMIGKPPARMDWASVHVFAVGEDGALAVERLNVSLESA
jgi:2,3-bisphosphoglycerate-dependent phosphoglycerate mutase